MAMTFAAARALALALPEVTEGTAYRTPALFVRRTVLARLREDGETLAVKCDFPERELWLATRPASFFLTDHYLAHPMVVVRLAAAEPADMRALLRHAWRRIAPARLLRLHGDDGPAFADEAAD